MRQLIRLLLTVLAVTYLCATAPAVSAGPAEVFVLEVEGAITTGQLSYIQRNVEAALKQEAHLLVLILNTPGGLVDATLKINETILNAPLPIADLVAPSGAIAASAGAFIVLGADIAAMVPGTMIGAAYPITVSPEGTTPLMKKRRTSWLNTCALWQRRRAVLKRSRSGL